jgi:probable HAF family extracellular repeat protein
MPQPHHSQQGSWRLSWGGATLMAAALTAIPAAADSGTWFGSPQPAGITPNGPTSPSNGSYANQVDPADNPASAGSVLDQLAKAAGSSGQDGFIYEFGIVGLLAGSANVHSGNASALTTGTSTKILPLPGGQDVFALATAFGTEFVAVGLSGTAGPSRAFRWTQSGGTQDLGSLAGSTGNSVAFGISDDGAVVVGVTDIMVASSFHPGNAQHAFRWSAATNTMIDLGSLAGPGGDSIAYAANGDGSVIVGASAVTPPPFQSSPSQHAFRWTLTPGTNTGVMEDLGTLDPSYQSAGSQATAVSSDGNVVAGSTTVAAGSAISQHAFRWTRPTGLVDLGSLPGFITSTATGINGDGSVIVGIVDPKGSGLNSGGWIANSNSRAFRWSSVSGMQDLGASLSAGSNFAGNTLLTATGITRDGQIIGGLGAGSALPSGAVSGYLVNHCDGPCPDLTTQPLAAVLPASRSVTVGGTPATAFATIINPGPGAATGCGVAPETALPANFTYQTTDPHTNALTGTANTPVAIAAGGSQSFVIAFTPTAAFLPTSVALRFACSGMIAAPVTSGLDTLLLSGSATPVPDVVALAASGDPGIVDIPGASGAGAFAVATVNVGAAGSITATANTGSATLPVSLSLCQTNPQTGACLATPAKSATTTMNANATQTFGIFVSGSGNVPFSPAVNRVFVQFADSNGVVRGSTSVAVRTQ